MIVIFQLIRQTQFNYIYYKIKDSPSRIMSAKKSTAELARDFYYFNQFGFTKAPVSLGDGGDEKLRRFAAALCNVSAADGEVAKEELAFIIGYCASKGYPQSIIDDIPEMCKSAESKSVEDFAGETKELLIMGSLQKSARQVVYDGIRAATADGLCESEKVAIAKIANSLGVSNEELDSIHSLVEKEKELKEERIKLLFPNGHPCLPKAD